MRVLKAEKHPNADALRVYEFTDDLRTYQVVANLDNVYEVDDTAIVATIGTILEDGTTIRETKIRGVISSGMAMGKTDQPVGKELSSDSPNIQLMSHWPDIESLFNVRKNMVNPRVVRYIPKVKLDGTNAGIQLYNGEFSTQSREQIITPESDNMGFSRWAFENGDYFKSLPFQEHVTIFGEWCGTGIQKRCSISKIGKKVFCVFAIQYHKKHGTFLDINPETIKAVLPSHPDIHVIPFHGEPIELNYMDVEILRTQAEKVNQLVSEVEACDPFVKTTFGVEGLGEGVVMYPLVKGFDTAEPMLVNRVDYTELVFKAKGEEHKVVKTKQAAQVDPEVVKSIDEFVELTVTENRLQQFAGKVELDVKKTGDFVKLLSQDVFKECTAELEASNMNWKQVAAAVSIKARNWWLAKCNIL
jgi:tRNA-binding EMAP/Myf-like protein